MEAIRILRDKERVGPRARFRLTAAGKFLNAEEEAKFRGKLERDNLGDLVNYVGFVSGNEKYKLLSESDVFCFPTFYSAESAPVVLLEAMAAGLPVVTTNWRNIPEMFPRNYIGIVEVRQPAQVANSLLRVLERDVSAELRANFLARFTIEQHLRGLAAAFLDDPKVSAGATESPPAARVSS
jgi:glycosyltransferase involved in cell wall biosynthesis